VSTVVVVALVAGALAVVALGVDGYRAARVDLDDAAVWVTGSAVALGDENVEQLGKVNTETPEIESVIRPSGAVDVFQSGTTVLYTSGRRLVAVQARTDEAGTNRRLPRNGARVALGGATAAILDTSTGSLWIDAPGALMAQAPDAQAPARVDRGSLLVVSAAGEAVAYRPGASQVHLVARDGTTRSVTLAAPVGEAGDTSSAVDSATDDAPVQLSAAGDRPVLLDTRTRTVTVGDAEPVTLPPDATGPALAQPTDADRVVVATDTGLFEVEGGSARRLVPVGDDAGEGLPAGAERAARPAVVGGCSYGAWHLDAGVHVQRVCEGARGDEVSVTIPFSGAMDPEHPLVFRINNGRAVLNDVESGTSWYIDRDNQVRRIDNWSEANEEDEPEKSDRTDIRDPKPKLDCDEGSDAPLRVERQGFGARVGIPAVLPVFADSTKVSSPSCSVLAVTRATASAGTVAVVGNGDLLQYTPDGSATTDTITYTVTDGTGGSVEATAAVTVHPADGTGNQPPDTRSDGRATSVVAGQIVSYNVLPGSIDPEGDALALVDACVGTGGTSCLDEPASDRPTAHGTVQHQSDGWFRYDAPSGISGVRTVAFAVQDQFGELSRGTVSVRIMSPDDPAALPVPHDDHVRLAVGGGGQVDPTANDVSPAGRSLVVNEISLHAAPAGVSRDVARNAVALDTDSNEVTIAESLPAGSYLYRYLVSDGATPVPGFVRVDVVERRDVEPVAVRDDAVLHGKRPLQLDLTANDLDPGGGVLVVQSIENPGAEGEGPQVQLLGDLKTARITAPDGFEPGSTPVLVRYAVSNGTRNATGVVVIRPFPGSTPQSPFPQPDGPVTVRPGHLVSVPVVDNDISPQGGPLRVLEVQGVDTTRGSAFVGGNAVRFVAAPDAEPGSTTFRYVVEDDDHNRASGRVTVRILDPLRPDRAPTSYSLSSRVFVGQEVDIEVPLLGADPEGQVVGIAGITRQPDRGEVAITPTGLRYTAGPDADADAGTQEIRFTLTDGGTNYSESVVRVGVAPLPFDSAAPAVTPIPVQVGVGQRRVVAVLDPLFVSAGTGVSLVTDGPRAPVPPRAGTGTIEVGRDGETIAYTAPDSLGGEDVLSTSFQYTVVDGNGRQQMNRVLVTVRPESEEVAPLVRDDYVLPTRAGREVEVDLLANDLDPNTGDASGLEVELVAGSGGPEDLRLNGGVATFEMPDRSVRFRYRVTSATSSRAAQGVVSVPVDLGATCRSRTFPVEAGGTATVDVLAGCTGPPGDEVVLVGASVDERVGTAVIRDQKLVFTARDVSSGAYPVAVRVCIDGPTCPNTTSSVVMVALVAGDNEPPEMADATVHVAAGDTSVTSLRRHLSDPNPGDVADIRFRPASFELVGGRVRGTVDAAGTVRVTATSDAYQDGRGSGTVEVRFSDGHELGDGTGTVTIVVDRSRAPEVVANDDVAVVVAGQRAAFAIGVLANDTNPSGDGRGRLEVGAVTQPAAGLRGRAGTTAVSADGGAVTFTPAAGFGGITTFTYTAVDPSDATRRARATVTLSVVGFPGLAGTPTGDGRLPNRIPLRWAPADGNGGQIDHYELQCQVVGGGGCPAEVPTRVEGTNVVVGGVANGTAYRFRVRAVNQAGPSRAGGQDGWSGWSGALVPDAVPEMTALTIGDFSGTTPDGPSLPDGVGNQLTLRWNARVDGSPIVAYVVTVNGAARTVPAGSPAFENRTLTWTGLANGTNVAVSVIARNAAGDSEPFTGTGRPMGPPAGATVVATTPGDRTIEVAWTWSPAAGEDAPSHFRVRASTGQVQETAAIRRPDGTYAAAFDLPNGTDVRFQVKGRNGAGWGTYGPFSDPVRPVGNPGRPQSATISGSDRSGHIRLTVVAPTNDGGAPITRYVFRGGGREVSFAPSTEPVDLPGFTNGEPVLAGSVVACNSYRGVERCSDERLALGTATPFGAPAAPSGFDATVSGNTVTWTWSVVPVPAGALGVRYRVSGTGITTATQNGRSITTGDLGCGPRTITISVQAVSVQGSLEQPGGTGTWEYDLPDRCPALDLSRGGAVAAGTGGCAGPNCFTVVAEYRNLANGTYTIRCLDADGDPLTDGSTPLTTELVVTGGAGSGTIDTTCAATVGTTLTLEATRGSAPPILSPTKPLP